MIERYELPGRSWVNPDDLTEEMCDEVRRAVEVLYDAICEHISLDENLDIDHELRVLYIGVKYLHLQPKADDT